MHALEFDRSGELVNQEIYDLERSGMEAADTIIAVSHLTRDIIINRYGIDPDKVVVVHNAVTKQKTIEKFKTAFPNQYFTCSVGTQIDL